MDMTEVEIVVCVLGAAAASCALSVTVTLWLTRPLNDSLKHVNAWMKLQEQFNKEVGTWKQWQDQLNQLVVDKLKEGQQ